MEDLLLLLLAILGRLVIIYAMYEGFIKLIRVNINTVPLYALAFIGYLWYISLFTIDKINHQPSDVIRIWLLAIILKCLTGNFKGK